MVQLLLASGPLCLWTAWKDGVGDRLDGHFDQSGKMVWAAAWMGNLIKLIVSTGSPHYSSVLLTLRGFPRWYACCIFAAVFLWS